MRRIARLAEVGPGDHVVEIGAGLGSLTLALAETGADVTAVEVDRGLVPVLREVVEPVGVRVVEADALQARLARRCSATTTGRLVANLPYNVATPLVADLLDGVPQIDRMLVMVQREVGERLAARAGDEALRRGHGEGRVLGDAPRSSDGCRRRCSCRSRRSSRRSCGSCAASSPAVADVDPDVAVLARARRVRSAPQDAPRSLAGVATVEQLDAAGVAPTARAEELDVDAWGRLAARGFTSWLTSSSLRPS